MDGIINRLIILIISIIALVLTINYANYWQANVHNCICMNQIQSSSGLPNPPITMINLTTIETNCSIACQQYGMSQEEYMRRVI